MASLLLHLAVLMAVSGSCRRKPDDRRQSFPIRVDYLETSQDRERAPKTPPIRPAAFGRVAPPARQATPAAGVQPYKLVGGAALPPVPDQRSAPREASSGGAPVAGIITHAGRSGTEMGSGPLFGGHLKATGSGSGGASGFGAGAGSYGGGDSAGAQGTGNSPSAAPGDLLQRRRTYLSLLKKLIEAHKEYPLAARKSRREGSCLRQIIISRNGTLKQVEVLSSCGCDFLDDAATRAIKAVGKFPPLPDDFRGTEESFTVTMTFTLAGN